MRTSSVHLAGVLAVLIVSAFPATITPPAYPLAVRSPYLSAWLPGDQSHNTPTANAMFWNGISLTWKVAARVDNKTYALFGYHDDPQMTEAATQVSMNYSSTHTTVILNAGGVAFILDWFSPVSPNNNLRQSLPFSYLTITILPGNGASIQIITGIDDSWVGPFNVKPENQPAKGTMGNNTDHEGRPDPGSYDTRNDANAKNNTRGPLRSDVKTNFTVVSGGTEDHQVPLFTSSYLKGTKFQESEQMAIWGTLVWATEPATDEKSSHGCDKVETIHQRFLAQGKLSTSAASSICEPGDFLAYAYDYGKVNSKTSRTFAIGYDTNPTVKFGDGNYTRFWRSQIKSLPDATVQFLEDYSSACQESLVLDEKIRATAESSVSSKYADLVEAAVRQAYGAVELVVAVKDPDPGNPMAFLKEISSDGNVNTVDVIFPTFPIYWALSPQYIRYHLQPYDVYISANISKLNYMVHDLGPHYPYAIGPRPHGEHLPLQSTSSFLTMHAVYQLATNDSQWGKNVLPKLQSYADFLRAQGMAGTMQQSTVDFMPAKSHQTGLAIQAAQALRAFGVMTGIDKYTEAAKNISNRLYHDGEGLDKDRKHFTFVMGDSSSWNVNSAAFTEKLLALDTFPQEAWDKQDDWYQQMVDPIGLPYVAGIELGRLQQQNCSSFVISEWNFFAAAAASSATQSKILDGQYRFFTSGVNPVPFPTRYCLDTSQRGHYHVCRARSTVGSVFAPMILNSKMKAGALGPPPGTKLGKRSWS